MGRELIDVIGRFTWEGERAAKGAAGDIGNIDRAADKASRSTGGLDSVIGGFVGGSLVLLSQRVGEAVQFLRDYSKEAIELAATAGETTSLLQNSLGPAYDGFISRLQQTAEATGRSRAELEQSTSTLIAMTKNAGFAAEEAGNLSATFADIALDLGSFFNRSTADVFLDIQSALGGSSEVMLKYGIDVKETSLRQAAFEAGIIDSNRALTQQERTLAIAAEIQRQASDAMGDAARTADSAANKAKALEDSYKDLQRQIGEKLLPVSEDWTEIQQQFIDDWGPALVDRIGETASAFVDLRIALREYLNQAKTAEDPSLLTRLLIPSETQADVIKRFSITRVEDAILEQLAKALGVDRETTRQIADQVRATEELFSGVSAGLVRIGQAAGEAAGADVRAMEAAIETRFKFVEVQRVLNDGLAASIPKHAEYTSELERLASVEDARARAAERVAEAQAVATSSFLSSLGDIKAASERAAELEEAFIVSDQSKVGGKTLDELVFEVGQQAGLAAPLLAQLASATGNYTTDMINAALETALLDAKIKELADRLINDASFSIEDARGELFEFTETLEMGRQGRLDAIEDVDNLGRKLDNIKSKEATVSVDIQGLDKLEAVSAIFASLGSRVVSFDATPSFEPTGKTPSAPSTTGNRSGARSRGVETR